MRFMLIRATLAAAVLIVLAGSASYIQAADPCSLGAGTDCPFQWVGVTSIAFDGAGNGLGFVGMTTQCRADFGPGVRMCKSAEIMDSDTLNFNDIPTEGCWVRPTWRGFNGTDALDESVTCPEETDPFRMLEFGRVQLAMRRVHHEKVEIHGAADRHRPSSG